MPILPRFTTYGGAVQRAIDPSSEFSTENPFTVLDLGCCFGQDLRRLVTDGLDPTENGRIRFVAADLHSELWELGFALFKDQSRLQATFQQLDWLDPDASARMFFERELKAKTDLIFACQFLHLFGWERQKIAVRRLIQCSRVGTVVMGYQIGSVDPRELSRPWGKLSTFADTKLELFASRTHCFSGNMYFHDVHTFQELWSEVAGEMSTSWILDVELVPLSNWGLDLEDWLWMGQDRRGLNFTCRRIGKGCDSMSLTNI